MYFDKKTNFFHGVTFHHFHDNKKFLPGQGSISAFLILKNNIFFIRKRKIF